MHIRLLVISLLALSFSAFAKPAFIEVNAKAQVQALPDFIQISVSIEKVGKNSADAKTATDSSSEALNALLKNEGIKDEDIEQARLSIYPDYQWHQGKRSLQGYKASRSVQIKLRDLDSYNEFMQKLSGLNLQRVSSGSGGFDNDASLEQKALVKALAKAEEKAKVMAEALGAKLGKVLMIQEGTRNKVGPRMYAEMAADSVGAAQASVGELQIKPEKVSASVSVQFQLK